jgi:hypothetical protein
MKCDPLLQIYSSALPMNTIHWLATWLPMLSVWRVSGEDLSHACPVVLDSKRYLAYSGGRRHGDSVLYFQNLKEYKVCVPSYLTQKSNAWSASSFEDAAGN